MTIKITRRIRILPILIFTITFLILSLTIQAVQTTAVFAESGPVPERREAAYERVIAHGGGDYQGYETTNSVEALNHSIESGYQIIELDMDLSSDNKIIMLHDWDRTAEHYYGDDFPKKLSQSQFLRLSVYGRLEVLNFDKLAGILDKNPDIRIVTDIKGDNIRVLTVIAEQRPDLVSRFIPQIYDYAQWDKVKALGYQDVILTLYAMADPDPAEIVSFAEEHDLYAVTMPDYMAERGICRQLSDQGLIVYVHPVNRYEDALKFMAQGAYGVYSGSLLRSEFDGAEKEYFLTSDEPDGTVAKLTDDRIEDWKELRLHGLKPGDTVVYFIDRPSGSTEDGSTDGKSAGDADFAGLKPGKHKLTVKIVNQEETRGTLIYYLWKDTANLRIVHKKYEYRLDAIRPEKDFYTVLQEAGISDEAGEILSRSLIARAGDSAYYINGSQESYMNGEEFLNVQSENSRKVLLPLSDTLRELGASSVTMDRKKDIAIVYKKEKSLIMADSSLLRRGFRITRLKEPVVLYLNKAMAEGEFYRSITGRDYLEADGRIIILPEGVEPDSGMKRQLLEFAEKLF